MPPVWLSLLLCIFSHMPTCSCISPCLLVSSSLIRTISCKFIPVFHTRDLESLLGILFDGTCALDLLGNSLLFDNMFVCPFICLTCLSAHFSLLSNVSLYVLSLPFCYLLCLYAGLFFLCCMYTFGARTFRARAQPPRRKQQGQGRKQEDASPKREMFSRLGGLASPSGFLCPSLSAFP